MKLMAFVALERCVNACGGVADEAPPEVPAKPPEGVVSAGYSADSAPPRKRADIMGDARRTLAAGLTVPPEALPRPKSLAGALRMPVAVAPVTTNAPRSAARSEQRSVSSILRAAWER